MISLLNVLNTLSHQAFRNIDKNCRITYNFFGIFVNFGPSLWHFFETNCFYLFEEAFRTTKIFLVQGFHYSKPPSLSKNRQKCMTFLIIYTFWDFCQFRSELEAFSKTYGIYLLDEASWTTNS